MVRRVLLIVVVLFDPLLGERTREPGLEFASADCHVVFVHPGDWLVRPDTTARGEPCAFFIRPAAWGSLLLEEDSVDLYTIRLRVLRQGFETVVATSAFERHDGDWVVLGGQGLESPAARIERRDWRGVWGQRRSGASDSRVATLACVTLQRR